MGSTFWEKGPKGCEGPARKGTIGLESHLDLPLDGRSGNILEVPGQRLEPAVLIQTNSFSTWWAAPGPRLSGTFRVMRDPPTPVTAQLLPSWSVSWSGTKYVHGAFGEPLCGFSCPDNERGMKARPVRPGAPELVLEREPHPGALPWASERVPHLSAKEPWSPPQLPERSSHPGYLEGLQKALLSLGPGPHTEGCFEELGGRGRSLGWALSGLGGSALWAGGGRSRGDDAQ